MGILIEHFMDKTIEIINNGFDDTNYTFENRIIIKEYDTIINRVNLCGSTPMHSRSYCIDNHAIIVCCGDTVFSFTLFDLALNWNIKIDEATAFEIYKMNEDYIIHGEMTISRINKDGKIIWQHGGSDIFVTIDGKNDFEIKGNYIYARTWDGRNYKFKYDGKDEYYTE